LVLMTAGRCWQGHAVISVLSIAACCCSSLLPLLCRVRHFAKYLEEDIGADDLEELYQKVRGQQQMCIWRSAA
jgi:hypothetical protein